MKQKNNYYIIGLCLLLVFGLFYINYSNSTFVSIENISSEKEIIKIISYDNEPIKIDTINTSWSDDRKFSAMSGQLLKGTEELNYMWFLVKYRFYRITTVNLNPFTQARKTLEVIVYLKQVI